MWVRVLECWQSGVRGLSRGNLLEGSFSCNVNTSISGATFVTNSCVHNLEKFLTSQWADTWINISNLSHLFQLVAIYLLQCNKVILVTTHREHFLWGLKQIATYLNYFINCYWNANISKMKRALLLKRTNSKT